MVSDNLVFNKFQKCNCPGCQTPYVQLVADSTLWFELPKNGSSSIKHSLEKKYNKPNPYLGISYDELKKVDFSQVNCYAILRNPYERFLSAYHQFVEVKAMFDNVLMKYDIKKSIVDIIDNIHLFDWEQRIHHFYPQWYFLKEYVDKIEFIPIEEIDKFFNIIDSPSINKNSFKASRRNIDSLTDIEKEKIYYLHKEDFDNLNFKKL